ncbi:MAG TPA: GNAT family N-acetyltransferase [Polyangiaceae bacterium]
MIQVRQARVSDYRFLKELHHAAYRDIVTLQFGNWNESEQDIWFEKSLNEAEYRIVELNGMPVGAFGVRDHVDHIALVEMQVLPQHQNMGIGSELLALELKRAVELELPVRLQVLRQNRARRFYTRSGFTLDGETDTHCLMIWRPDTLGQHDYGGVVARPALGTEALRDERDPSKVPLSVALEWEGVDGSPLPADAKTIDEGLERFNQSAADFTTSLKFACIARLGSGTVVGGALARWWGRCCELQQVWVDEHHRLHGAGRRLVQMVEVEARRRGCSLLYLDTFSFQAPAFYLKLGYEVACEFKGFPNGVSKFVLRKSLISS